MVSTTLDFLDSYPSAIYYPNADRYAGQVHISSNSTIVPHGYGTMIKANGETYTGYFYEGLRHGQGQSYSPATQRLYSGSYQLDQEDGYATITMPGINGRQRQYAGFMQQNQRHGSGRQWETSVDGQISCFEGVWINDQLCGQGKYIVQGIGYGQCCEGIFVNGQLEGMGAYTDMITGLRYNVLFSRGTVVQWF